MLKLNNNRNALVWGGGVKHEKTLRNHDDHRDNDWTPAAIAASVISPRSNCLQSSVVVVSNYLKGVKQNVCIYSGCCYCSVC